MRKLILLLTICLAVGSCAFPQMKFNPGVCYHNHSGKYLRCANFDFNYGNLESVSQSENVEFEYGHKRISLDVKGWEELINYLDRIYVWKDKNFKKKDKKRTPKKRTGGREILEFFN